MLYFQNYFSSSFQVIWTNFWKILLFSIYFAKAPGATTREDFSAFGAIQTLSNWQAKTHQVFFIHTHI